MINELSTKRSRVSASSRLALLTDRGEVIFHIKDVANLWGITDANALRTTLSRYAALGLIHRIYRGLYSLVPVSDLDPYLLGIKVLHAPAYVSCETILYKHGIMNQSPRAITLVSGVSKRFTVAGRMYRSRKMKDEMLFNEVGVETVDGVRKASVSRAVVDMLYYSPLKYLDAADSRLVDWQAVKSMQKALGCIG